MKKLYALFAIGVVIFLMVQYPHTMINPGELVKGHQELNNKCLSCHQPFDGISNEKCTSCHKISDIGKDSKIVKSKTLFHQELSNQECSTCHTDHQGIFPERSLNDFKHELLSAAIINNCNSCHIKPNNILHKQVSANCSSCHQTTSWKSSVSFNHDLLLNKNECASCHQKPSDVYHAAITDNCSKCHSTTKWVPSTFNHTAFFKLDQNHNATCKTCHTNNNFSSFTCYGCHEHNERNIIAEHNEEGITNIANCVSCHSSGNEHGIKNNSKSTNGSEQKKINDFIKSNDSQKIEEE